ncbi:MAG: sodium:solute symporter family protein [Blautia sp.]|nr:sodium:solute symporter family protein [Blautia sp.]
MNIYFIGMCISMAIYILVSYFVSRRIKSVDDYFVAGRRAPMLLISGSLVASYIGTGMFMGDAQMYYEGVFSVLIIVNSMASAGYIIGAVFFGRYLRRSKVTTIPEFFEKRFCSAHMRKLSSGIAVIVMTVYCVTVVKGISTLMSAVTGVDPFICAVIAMSVFTLITVMAGSSGVLITDTMMATLFTVITLVCCILIAQKAGGWNDAVKTIVGTSGMEHYLSWEGQPGLIMNNGRDNMIWALTNGIVWMSVTMVSPWQTSRYMMAKDENVVVRSSVPAAIGIFIINIVVGMTAMTVNVWHPELSDTSRVLIWAAMNILPGVLGVLLLTGVLSAGISSATTFLSLIGTFVTNDLAGKKSKNPIRTGRIVMIIASLIVLLYNRFGPPGLFWIMYMGGTTICSAYMPVTMGSILSKRLTKAGAYAGMLCGFVSCFGIQVAKAIIGFSLPIWLDPSIIGFVFSVAGMVLVSAVTKVTPEETQARARLFEIPENEKNPREVRKTLGWIRLSMASGVLMAVVLVLVWVVPYMSAK